MITSLEFGSVQPNAPVFDPHNFRGRFRSTTSEAVDPGTVGAPKCSTSSHACQSDSILYHFTPRRTIWVTCYLFLAASAQPVRRIFLDAAYCKSSLHLHHGGWAYVRFQSKHHQMAGSLLHALSSRSCTWVMDSSKSLTPSSAVFCTRSYSQPPDHQVVGQESGDRSNVGRLRQGVGSIVEKAGNGGDD